MVLSKREFHTCLLGAAAGDIIGSPYEFVGHKDEAFPLFQQVSMATDDTILTAAVAEAILTGRSYETCLREFALEHPGRGYGGMFHTWIHAKEPRPYNSYGNGAAMRVSAVGWAFNTLEDVLAQAAASAAPTHNHPEGIKGAQATALAVWMARRGEEKKIIREEISARFGYDLQATVESIRPGYRFYETCQQTVPQALIAFFDSTSFEDAVRKTVSLGGDADTLGAITGAVAEAYYGGVPAEIADQVWPRLPERVAGVLQRFAERYNR